MNRAMRRRLMLLLFFAWVAVDLASPFVPGAFSFEPAECVAGVSGPRARPVGVDAIVVARADARRREPALRVRPPASTPARPATWRPHVAHDHVVRLADTPPTDDD